MKVALDPITPSPQIELELEKEIVTWFEETLFRPLFDLFGEERQNSAGADWVAFPKDLGSLGLSRADMPQIESKDRGSLISFLAGLGICHGEIEVPPGKLKPTQRAYSPARVDKARAHEGEDRAVLASSDLRIIDGHHQWYAALLDKPREHIKVIVFDVGVPRLITEIASFPSVVRDNEMHHPNLDQALFSGRASYSNGTFSGEFTAAISKDLRELGARFDLRSKTYKLAIEDTPYSLRGAIAFSGERSRAIHAGLERNLALIAENVAAQKALSLNIQPLFTKVLRDLSRQFTASVEKASKESTALEAITVGPDFTEGMVRDVRQHLTETLELPIKTFTEEQTLKLRQLVEENWNLGGRVDRMRDIIEDRFGVTKRKAAFLARQETTMLASEFARARAQEIGSTEYIWVTRRDAKVRLDHQALNGLTFLWDDPPVADRERDIHANPGMVYGCLPGDAKIKIAHRIKRAFRRYYVGDLAVLILDGDRRFRATPNHPVLTVGGWKPISHVNQSDHVIQMPFESVDPIDVEAHHENSIATLDEIFGAFREASIGCTAKCSGDDFHGDGTNGQVDVVGSTRFLWIDRKADLAKRILNHVLARPAAFASSISAFTVQFIPPFPRLCLDAGMSGLGEPLAVLEACFTHTHKIRLRLASDRHIVLDENTADHASANSGSKADRQLALSGNVSLDDWRGFGTSLVPCRMGLRNGDPARAKMIGYATRTKADELGHFFKRHSFGQKTLRVMEVRREKFSGHVYNLETATGWYGVDGLIFHNCRCVARPLLNISARRVVA